MGFLLVRPSDEDIAASRVAFWEIDADDHSKADPKWGNGTLADYGGAYITGNPKNPKATYVIAETKAALRAIKDGRLVLLSNNAEPVGAPEVVPVATADPVKPTAPAVVPPAVVPPADVPPADVEPPAPVETVETPADPPKGKK
jgi:hypothetical protein